MKKWIVCASALVLAAACGSSKEATAALEAMNLAEGKGSGIVQYASKSGSGDKVTLKDVVLGGGSGNGIKASQMVLDGLDVTADGKPLVSSITLKDIQPEQAVPGLTFNLASVSISNANEPVAAFMAAAFTEAGPGDPPPFEQWQFGKISVNGLKVQGDLAAMGAGGGSFTVNMDELSASNLKDTIFGAAKFAGLKGDFNIPAEAGAGFPIVGKYDFGAADLKGVRGGIYADAFAAGLASGGDPSAVSQMQADMIAKMKSPIDPGYDQLTWTPMSFEASGAKLTISRLEMKATRTNDVVTAVSSPRATIAFTADAAGGTLGQMAGGVLSMVGYPTVELYAESDATYDPATDTTRYKKYNFGLTDGFDMQMTGGLQGLTKALASLVSAMTSVGSITPPEPVAPDDPADPNASPAEPTPPAEPAAPDMSGLAELKVVDMELTLTDKSLISKIFNLAPMMGAQDPEALRNDIVNMLSTAGADLANAGFDAQVSNELMTAVSNFIKQPGVLKITLKPAAPVALAAPGAKLDKATLGFSAVHTPGATPAAPN
jgi:hypothetical protein